MMEKKEKGKSQITGVFCVEGQLTRIAFYKIFSLSLSGHKNNILSKILFKMSLIKSMK